MIMRAHRQDALVAALATEPGDALPPSGRTIGQNDIAIQNNGEPVKSIVRFHNALRELTGRRGIRDDVSRYEAVCLALTDPAGMIVGSVLDSYPASESPLRIERSLRPSTCGTMSATFTVLLTSNFSHAAVNGLVGLQYLTQWQRHHYLLPSHRWSTRHGLQR